MLNTLNEAFFSLPKTLCFLIITAVMVPFSLVAYKKRHLTLSGALSAFVTGFIVFWCTGVLGFLLLLFFYASAYIIHYYKKAKFANRAYEDECNEKKSNTRDAMQVFANAFMAVFSALYYYNTENITGLIVFGAALAESASDTWAGEIGRLSSRPPFSIKTFKIVPRGMSGGVTPLGFLAAFVGSVSTALLWVVFFKSDYAFLSFSIIALSGFAGCIADSYLGATFQAMYVDEEKNALTEEDTDKEGRKRTLVRGIPWIDNDIVNLMSNIFATLFAYILGKSL